MLNISMWVRMSVVVGVVMSVVPEAFGGACTSSDAPSAFTSASCNAGGTNDICYYASGGLLKCGMARNGSTTAATGTVVANFNAGTNTYSGWGTAANGNNFCCVYSGANVIKVEMYGGTSGDTLSFFFDNGTIHRDLEPSGALFISSITAYMSGGDGADTMQGSFKATNYSEELFGDDGNDAIDGNDGGDTIRGWGGDDILHGGDGDDNILGGTGADKIAGDGGDDTMEGESEDDIICDYDDRDMAWGHDNDDVIWLAGVAGGGTAQADGGAGNDECGEDPSTEVTCTAHETSLTSEPGACSGW